MSKELPDLHRQAFKYKNSKKLQHDGGRAWIKDSQLYEARHGVNGKLLTRVDKQLKEPGTPSDKVKSI
ncbi:hypothetical protein DYD21_10825 [Rhodohalobacter sp. SW132]|uniref:hypothetical protein n=1 Tax=Rhodohalobacter sp. SW132 TaxID=2293433 RepID=UPI000E2670B1|nr:hypothetical protein [Rhodohalobacter sp. SW132]REL33268.1 hypothetical protein DYD21_10825 [Rhodohalobacter sp. SW132]